MTATATVSHVDEYSARVAALLRGYLATERVNRRALARKIRQTDWWIGRRVNGQTALTVGELATIAEALGEPISRFLPEDTARQAIARLGVAGSLSARSSTDRASDYGSEVEAPHTSRPSRYGRRRSDRPTHLRVVA